MTLKGDNGILEQANKARKKTEEAKKEEENIFAQAEIYIVGKAEVGKIVKESNKTINGKSYSYRNPVIPEGFAAIETEDATWNLDSEGNPKGWNKGLVISDEVDSNGNSVGNEFVWIAVDNEKVNYDRIAYSKEGWENSQSSNGIDTETNSLKIVRNPSIEGYYCVEMLAEDERDSVNKYGGFYIGRYEAGVKNYTDINFEGFNEPYSIAPSITIREGETVWTLITKKEAQRQSEQLYFLNKAVKSKLISSYAWDTALKFISQVDEEFPTNSTNKGNYNNYINDVRAHKTGKYKQCNIYDMAGNIHEQTTEELKGGDRTGVVRGGSLAQWCSGTSQPAASAFYSWYKNNAEKAMGFRVTVYIKP